MAALAAEQTGSSENKMSVKLVIDSKANKVVLAEVDKDFVDFLFDILSLSVGTVVQLLNDKDMSMAGCLGDLHRSVEALSQDYLLPNVTKDIVLKQRSPINVPMLSLKYALPTSKSFYYCPQHYYITDGTGVACPNCGRAMSSSSSYKYVAPDIAADATALSSASGGYVKSMVKYMVMDNLEVKPMSFSLLKDLFKDVGRLIEQDVQVGLPEGLAILEASLKTQSVLTTVFLGKKIKLEP